MTSVTETLYAILFVGVWVLVATYNTNGLIGINAQEYTKCYQEQCFHQPESSCPSAESKCRCRLLPQCKRAAVCCNIKSQIELDDALACANWRRDNLYALHVRNATISNLNMSSLTLHHFHQISFTDGNITAILGEIPSTSSITCVNLSSNQIKEIDNRLLVNAYNLRFMNLSNNKFSVMPNGPTKRNITLDISNNQQIYCYSIKDLLRNNRLIVFSNEKQTSCQAQEDLTRDLHYNHISLSNIQKYVNIEKGCPMNCKCVWFNIINVEDNESKTAFHVSCSNINRLPTPLPPYTTLLNISNNNITTLESISTDSSYQYLRKLYAYNNRIDSLLPLKDSYILLNYHTIDLRNNTFKTIPTSIFTNAFVRTSEYLRYLNLGQNRIRCDCNVATIQKEWLISKSPYFKDIDEIYCDDNDQSAVIYLNPKHYCKPQLELTDYLSYIIAVEVFLLLSLISKVCYDYWIFKTTGYLPWPANKIPKLPFDWLCE